MQQGTTADLVHSVPALVAYLSQLMTLEPGDVVATGTPSGVGSLRDPKVWLKAGRRDRDLIAAARCARDAHRLTNAQPPALNPLQGRVHRVFPGLMAGAFVPIEAM